MENKITNKEYKWCTNHKVSRDRILHVEVSCNLLDESNFSFVDDIMININYYCNRRIPSLRNTKEIIEFLERAKHEFDGIKIYYEIYDYG